MAGLAGDDDSSFFGDDDVIDGEEFCYGPFDAEDLCYGTFEADDGEEFCYNPFAAAAGGGDGGGEEFCVSGFSFHDLSDAHETGVPRDDDPLPQTLARSSSSRSFDFDGELATTLAEIMSAVHLSDDDDEEEEGEVVEGLMVSAFDLDTAMAIGNFVEDLQVVMGDEEIGQEEEEEREFVGDGEGMMPNGSEFGLPRVVSGTAVGFRMMVDADDTDSDDFTFVELLGAEVGEAGNGAAAIARPSRASQLVVESLPEAMLSEGEASSGCAVCKDCFSSGQLVALLLCKHYFHGDCIWPWLAMRNTCPVCRQQVCTDDPEYEKHMARRVVVLAPVENQGAPAQSGGDRATMGAEGVAENGPEQSSS
uniref:RING-type domain-containing protein n=1 Tax=Leersia perrieri TaxID=77586 RepID=A0A0D9VD76_9ORYZ